MVAQIKNSRNYTISVIHILRQRSPFLSRDMLRKGLLFFVSIIWEKAMSYEELVKKLSPKLKAIARKLDGRYTAFDEDDLYQEALFRLWQKYKENELSDKTDSYILQGCLFFLKNHIRKVHKKIDSKSISLHNIINENAGTLEDVLSFTYDMENPLNDELALEEIYAMLSEKEREIIDLSLDNLTVREIGKRFGISHVMVLKIKKQIKEKCSKIKKEIT